MDPKALVGTLISNKYQVLELAGSGGMGSVFKARQNSLNRIVALKILNSLSISDDDSAKRFEQEAKSLCAMSHVHIASFYSYEFLNDSVPYLVMEWLDGESLDKVLRKGKLSQERALNIAAQTADAMSHAHSAGVVHRDLKPGNIMLISSATSEQKTAPEQRNQAILPTSGIKYGASDFVKIVDFGLVKVQNAETLTKTGLMVGTPQYCSPEQCLGQQIDGRSDIYSLGCILYEMFCGEPPFESDNAIGVVYMHIHEKPVQPSKKTADKLSPGVEAIICKCLEKKASDRYQSMQELLADLTLVANGDGDKIAIAKEAQTEKKPKVIILTTLGLIAFCLLYFTLAKFASVHSDSRTKTASIKSTKINSTADSKQLIESQLQANAFRQEKQIEKAAELERKIKQQCYYLCKEPRAALPILTDVSASLDKQGDFNGSKKFALMVFDCLSRLDKQNQIFDGMYKYAEAVCQGLLNSKRHLTSDQARIVEQVSFIPMFPDAGSSESQYTANLVVLEHNYHRFPLTKEYANALSKKITSDITSGKADDAEISECINANLQVNGKYSLASANMFIDMGRTYNLAGHKANARKYGRLAKECLEQNQDSHDNLDVGVSWARLGQMYSSLSDANDCIYCCRKAVEITEFECKGLSAVKLRQPAGTDSLSNTLDVFAAAEKEFLFRTETLVQNLIHFNRFAECENVAKELYTQSLKSEGIPERLRIDSARHLIDVLTELKKFDKARQIIAEVGAFYKAHLLKKRAESFHEQTTTDGSMRELIKDLIRLHMEKEAIETLPTLAQVQSRQSKERIVLLEIYTYIALSDAAKLKDSFNNALAVGPSASILSARTQTWIELIEYAKNNFNSEENKKLKNFLSECIKTMVSKTDIDSLAIAKICASIRYVLKDEALYQELNAFIEQSLPKYKLELYRQDYAVAAGEK